MEAEEAHLKRTKLPPLEHLVVGEVPLDQLAVQPAAHHMPCIVHTKVDTAGYAAVTLCQSPHQSPGLEINDGHLSSIIRSSQQATVVAESYAVDLVSVEALSPDASCCSFLRPQPAVALYTDTREVDVRGAKTGVSCLAEPSQLMGREKSKIENKQGTQTTSTFLLSSETMSDPVQQSRRSALQGWAVMEGTAASLSPSWILETISFARMSKEQT